MVSVGCILLIENNASVIINESKQKLDYIDQGGEYERSTEISKLLNQN